MTKWLLLLIVAGLAVAGWFNRDKFSSWTTTKASVEQILGPATPHPATASTALAIKAFPALGVEGSPFNKKFVQLFSEMKETNPAFLSQPDWPMQLAERTAHELGGAVAAVPSATPAQMQGGLLDVRPPGGPVSTVAPRVQLPGFQGTSLDQRPAPRGKPSQP